MGHTNYKHRWRTNFDLGHNCYCFSSVICTSSIVATCAKASPQLHQPNICITYICWRHANTLKCVSMCAYVIFVRVIGRLSIRTFVTRCFIHVLYDASIYIDGKYLCRAVIAIHIKDERCDCISCWPSYLKFTKVREWMMRTIPITATIHSQTIIKLYYQINKFSLLKIYAFILFISIHIHIHHFEIAAQLIIFVILSDKFRLRGLIKCAPRRN